MRFPHLVRAAVRATSLRCSGLSFFIRAAALNPAFYYETYQRLGAEQPFFQELAAYGDRVRMNVSVNGVAESTMGQLVSGNYYAVLGVPPASGRVFNPGDDRVPGTHPVAVISYAYWQRRFGGSAAAIGKNVLIDGTPFTIIGVSPPGFYGLQVGMLRRSASR